MPDHAATEAMLEDSGLAFTALRNGFYASSGRMLLGQAFETGELAAPADGPVSWTAHDDLAEAAAIVLTDEGRFEGPTPPLTGSAALDLAGLAAEVTGRPITPHGPDRRPVPGGGSPSPSPTCSSACSPRAGPGSSPPWTRPSESCSAGPR